MSKTEYNLKEHIRMQLFLNNVDNAVVDSILKDIENYGNACAESAKRDLLNCHGDNYPLGVWETINKQCVGDNETYPGIWLSQPHACNIAQMAYSLGISVQAEKIDRIKATIDDSGLSYLEKVNAVWEIIYADEVQQIIEGKTQPLLPNEMK